VEWERTKIEAIDGLEIAWLAAQKRPLEAHLLDVATEELRELSRLRERLAEDSASVSGSYTELLTLVLWS
jgi:hypothetical protein